MEDLKKEKAPEGSSEAKNNVKCADADELMRDAVISAGEAILCSLNGYSNIDSFTSRAAVCENVTRDFCIKIRGLPKTRIHVSVKAWVSSSD